MRRHLQFLTVLAALAAPCGMAQAQTLSAAKIAGINKAAEALIASAKDPYNTGQAPRETDAAARPLFDAVFNTKDLEGAKPLPWTAVPMLQDWNRAIQRIGLMYYLTGTGTTDVAVVSADRQKIVRANSNTATFAAEFGRYYDAQMRIHSAMVDTALAQIEAATPEMKKDNAFKITLNAISDSTAKAMIGILGSIALEEMPNDWVLLRTVALLDLTPRAARFMEPNDRQQVRNAAIEVAEQSKNPDVKSGINTIARALQTL